VDFVSRYFTPQSSILEDPATGSSHCSLIPYWSRKLNKKKLKSLQLSIRKGEFECENKDERVLVTGKAFTDSIEIKNY
jgi:predicted PhzF superfamily epimerase YddE/YHI9